MNYKTPRHYSHSYALKLDSLPTKKSDRIALRFLYPGMIFGAILAFLGIYELLNGMTHTKTDFDLMLSEGAFDYQPLISAAFFDSVIILIGLGIIVSLLFSYIRYRKIMFDGKTVTIVSRPVFGSKKVFKEDIGRYDGVLFRIEFCQLGFMTKNKYIIELHHKNPDKAAPLYISTSNKNIRKLWEYYAKKLNLPALIITDEGLIKREIEDFDKDIRELVKTGKIVNAYNDNDPLPPSIDYVRKRDKTVIKSRKIFWDAYNIIAWICVLLTGGLMIFASLNFEQFKAAAGPRSVAWFYALTGGAVIAAVFALFRKDKIVVKKDKVVIVHKFMLFSRKNDEIKKSDIEAIDVTVNPATGRYYLSIISDEKSVVFGKKVPIEDLRWVKKFLTNEIVKN